VRKFYTAYIAPLYLSNRLFFLLSAAVILFVVSFFLHWIGELPGLVLLVIVVLLFIDYALLFTRHQGVLSHRILPERLSNGDDNEVMIQAKSSYPFTLYTEIIDEVPFQFQLRDLSFPAVLSAGSTKVIRYHLRPVKRGEYDFGQLNIYARSPLGLAIRRYRFGSQQIVPVYPSYLQMRRYQLLAISNRLSEIGVKKIRRIGHSMEFEQIREYVQGDDIRTLNWKATARRNQMMVNSYTDEKSQQVYCVIDKSRVMKMPFNNLSLLDYAINASLVLSNVALLKQDKAGLISFAENIGNFLPASGRATQMNSILETLYRQKTRYLESDFEKLYSLIRQRITQRSLVVLFTNFESLNALHRQMTYLRKIARNHLLMVVFFENTELTDRLRQPADNLEEIYTQTIAAKFAFEKKLIVRELQQYGIISILTPPEELTVNTVNKYLELKSRQAI
jgi:uncharacterized protein (DUF58 family)